MLKDGQKSQSPVPTGSVLAQSRANRAKANAGEPGNVPPGMVNPGQTRNHPGYTYTGSSTLSKYFTTGPGSPGYALGPTPTPVSPTVILPPSPVVVSPAPSGSLRSQVAGASKTYAPVREYENGATMYQNRVSGYLYWEGPNGERVEYQPRHDRMYVDGEQTTKFPSWLPIEEQRMIKSQGLR